MQEPECRRNAHDRHPGVFRAALPELDERANTRIVRKPGIDFRFVGVMENVHHVRTADAGRIVETGVVIAAGLQVLDAAFGVLLHFFFGAEGDGVGRTGLGASRTLADGNAIRAKRALIRFVIDLGDARNVERATFHAVAAADAVLVHEVDDAVRVLNDRAGRGAGLETARILAMHATVLADQPF